MNLAAGWNDRQTKFSTLADVDRTGTIIACYRIQQDHWANSSALKEAEVYGLSPFEVGMRNYIKHFKK